MNTQHTVVVNRIFNCSPEELFNWLIDPLLIAKWFGPKNLSVGKVKTDTSIGGHYSIELKKSSTDIFFYRRRVP